MKQKFDQQFMRFAMEEGAKGLGLTAPNPSVGAVLVKKGKIIGKGFHHQAGLPHAEREAFADCRNRGNDPRGSEIFITLEPCSTTGRTPPCTEAILQNGVKRVIWAANDPNPAHQGNARNILVAAGIEVTTGVLQKEAEHLHRAFFKVQRQGLPWVIVKTAMSLDGRITKPPGEDQWLTGSEARADVQALRSEADIILTSGETARNDNPRLDYRGDRSEKKQPLRVVFTHRYQAGLPNTAHLLKENESGPTRFIKGNFKEHLQAFAAGGYHTLFIEAGGNLVGQLLDQGLVDEWITYLAPLVTGGNKPAVAGQGTVDLSNRPRLHQVAYQQFGRDIRIRGKVARKQDTIGSIIS